MAVATLPVALLLKYPARLSYALTGGVTAKSAACGRLIMDCGVEVYFSMQFGGDRTYLSLPNDYPTVQSLRYWEALR